MTGSTSLSAFTAVTSGSWSSAATWGGIGPGSSVSNADIIIPSGITVDMDVDVQFNGLLNSFIVSGSLISTTNEDLEIINGTINGAGAADVRKLTLSSATAIYTFTGPITVDVFRNAGSTVSVVSQLAINDSLDLEAGSVVINAGGVLQMMGNSNIRVNGGVLTNGGGTFVTGAPYDIWYVGATKFTAEEINSSSVNDVHVMLNSNSEDLTMNAQLTVNGDLDMTAGHVVLNGNRLRLFGDLTRNSGAIFESDGLADMEIAGSGGALTAGLAFAVNSTLDELTIARDTHTVYLMGDMTVTNQLHLEEGQLSVAPGASLAMGAGSMISVVQGGLDIDGSFNGTQSYNVEYIGDSRTSGAELSGSGLTDLSLYLWTQGSIITLSQDVAIPGNFSLTNGILSLDTFDIRFDGDFYQSCSNSLIYSSFLSNMTFSMATSVNDSVRMGVGSGWGVQDLVIDLPPGSVLMLADNAVVIRYLILNGGKISPGAATLHVVGPGAVINYSDTRYVQTSGSGGLRMGVQSNSTMWSVFPVGTTTAYAPVQIKQQLPAPNGFFEVHVRDGVFEDGTTGTNVATTMSVVNKTWVITGDSAMPMNMDLRAGWVVADEVNGFDRTQSFIKHYNNGNMWDSYTSAAAAAGADNTYEVERIGLTSGGPFAVADNNAPLGVPVATIENPSDVYPNPTTDIINVTIVNPANDNMQYEIYDAAGRLVNSFQNANASNQIDMKNYDNGSYTLRVTNTVTNEVTTRLIIKS